MLVLIALILRLLLGLFRLLGLILCGLLCLLRRLAGRIFGFVLRCLRHFLVFLDLLGGFGRLFAECVRGSCGFAVSRCRTRFIRQT